MKAYQIFIFEWLIIGFASKGVGDDDDAEDEDWLEPGRSVSNSRKKRDKNSPRRNRAHKLHAKWKPNEEESHVDMERFTKRLTPFFCL